MLTNIPKGALNLALTLSLSVNPLAQKCEHFATSHKSLFRHHKPTLVFQRTFSTRAKQIRQELDPLRKLKLELSGRESQSGQLDHKNSRLLKVAIIGLPNSGKSTLINQIIGRRACSTSRKVHTTRCSARAVFTEEHTQVVFVDTPGLVDSSESQKHHLERTFLVDPDESVSQADLIAVVHDASNKWTRETLDAKVLRLLYLNANKETILILNKTDAIKRKQTLLQLNRLLTENMLAEPDTASMRMPVQLSELQLRKLVKQNRSWPHFCEVFMVSALTGDGIGDIREYLMSKATPSPWLFPKSTLTDQEPIDIILQAVQEKLLDYLPKEMPYEVNPVVEFVNQSEEGFITIVILIPCPKKNLAKILLGRGAHRIKKIAQEAEQELQNTFRETVQLKLVVDVPEKEKSKH